MSNVIVGNFSTPESRLKDTELAIEKPEAVQRCIDLLVAQLTQREDSEL